MTIDELKSKTVLELRKIAKEYGVVLGAGINKSGIIDKLAATGRFSTAAAEDLSQTPKLWDLPELADKQERQSEPDAARQQAAEKQREPEKSLPVGAKTADADEQEKPQLQYKAAWHNPTGGYSGKNGHQQPRSANSYSPRNTWPNGPTQPRVKSAPETIARQIPARTAGFTHHFGPELSTRPASPFQQPAGNVPVPENRRFVSTAPAEMPRAAEPSKRPDPFGTSAYKPTFEPSRPSSFGPRSSAPGNVTDPAPEKGIPEPAPAQESGNVVEQLLAEGDYEIASGILEVHPDGYGFLRAPTFLSSSKDIYVAMAQIRRFGLRSGDMIEGKVRPKREGDRYAAMLYITSVNGREADQTTERPAFDELTATYPTRRVRLEVDGEEKYRGIRLVDLIAPLGFGQRELILCPPDTGKDELLRDYANAITRNHPEAEVMVLLIDVNPEDATLFRNQVDCQVLATTFDQSPENHLRLTELVLERSMRLAEEHKDVVLIVDSLTKLAKVYTGSAAQQGRSMPGMVNPTSLFRAKRLFGAARCLEEGGSLTVIAAMDIGTGSKVDDSIVEEFKGTANMEVVLDQAVANAGVRPALNIQQTGTRRADILLDDKQKEGLRLIRGMVSSLRSASAVPQLMSMMDKAATNDELLLKIKSWVALMNKTR